MLSLVTHAQPYRFNIPTQSLDAALKQFGLQANRQVLFSAEAVVGQQSNTVIGNFDDIRALELLLPGTGLTFESTASNVLLIKKEPAKGVAPLPGAIQKRTVPKIETDIEEVTVTAQKREENRQEIPLSVTVIGPAQLEEHGVANVRDIGGLAPNVRIVSNPGSSAGVTITIRGVGGGSPSVTQQQPAGMYVDGAFIAKLSGSNLDLDDLERVEVLRGPQGTLYGRNTIAGTINFVTAKPTDERLITVRTEGGNFDTFNGRLTINLPLIGKNGWLQSDALGTISLREAVAYRAHDGFFRNASPTAVPAGGSRVFNNLNRVFSRTALRWEPTGAVTIDYSAEYHRYSDASSAFQLTFLYPESAVATGPFDLTPYIRTNRVEATGNNAIFESAKFDAQGNYIASPLADDGNHRMHVLTGEYRLGELGPLGTASVRSISAFRDFTHRQAQDMDGSPLHVLEFQHLMHTQHWSEELQWVGAAPRFRYVAGAYYYGERAVLDQSQVLFAGASDLPYRAVNTVSSYAPFGQVTYTPPFGGDKFSVTVGVRYTQEQVHVDKSFRCITAIAPVGGTPINTCNQAFIPSPSLHNWSSSRGKAFGGADGISPIGAFSYQWTDDLMTYFRIARGFKSGGFNGTTNDPRAFAVPFGPEKLLQYEAGFKAQWFDHRLLVNATGFYSDYSDLQQTAFRPSPQGGVFNILSNVDSAEIWGSEVEVITIPVRGLEATAYYSLALPKFLKWLDQRVDAAGQPIFDPNGRPVLENVAGHRAFAMMAEHQASAGLRYTAAPTASGTFSAHLDVSWQDKVNFVTNNETAGAQAMKAPNYAVVNGRLQLAEIPLQQGTLDLALFGRNLFDKKYRIYGIDFGSQLGLAGNAYGDPRTFGLGLTYNFSAS
ncbi:MAG: TonB-dependent receptor [Deltaproteobacteria bacterium]|nr:TonB-dependent receptor [Deltaproteobacteria bacterium]